ncbi:hypothetical protein F383_22300 [Gossypium arboreum]|uniref:Uncharacterized protein n=1 Tax=Gossypium arboreum TaxID=29729 RepID=A0A0B0MLC9_GOSAR|nr:hypothetical protein F383_22300 [Gossypium arboreum]
MYKTFSNTILRKFKEMIFNHV